MENLNKKLKETKKIFTENSEQLQHLLQLMRNDIQATRATFVKDDVILNDLTAELPKSIKTNVIREMLESQYEKSVKIEEIIEKDKNNLQIIWKS